MPSETHRETGGAADQKPPEYFDLEAKLIESLLPYQKTSKTLQSFVRRTKLDLLQRHQDVFLMGAKGKRQRQLQKAFRAFVAAHDRLTKEK